MRRLKGSVVVKRELSQEAKLSLYRLFYVIDHSFTYGHELWAVTYWRDYITWLAWKRLVVPLEGVGESGQGEECLDLPA